jgi:hypothetical protein
MIWPPKIRLKMMFGFSLKSPHWRSIWNKSPLNNSCSSCTKLVCVPTWELGIRVSNAKLLPSDNQLCKFFKWLMLSQIWEFNEILRSSNGYCNIVCMLDIKWSHGVKMDLAFIIFLCKCQKTLEKKITYHNDCHTIKCSFNIYVYLICYVYGWGMYKQLNIKFGCDKEWYCPKYSALLELFFSHYKKIW